VAPVHAAVDLRALLGRGEVGAGEAVRHHVTEGGLQVCYAGLLPLLVLFLPLLLLLLLLLPAPVPAVAAPAPAAPVPAAAAAAAGSYFFRPLSTPAVRQPGLPAAARAGIPASPWPRPSSASRATPTSVAGTPPLPRGGTADASPGTAHIVRRKGPPLLPPLWRQWGAGGAGGGTPGASLRLHTPGWQRGLPRAGLCARTEPHVVYPPGPLPAHTLYR